MEGNKVKKQNYRKGLGKEVKETGKDRKSRKKKKKRNYKRYEQQRNN